MNPLNEESKPAQASERVSYVWAGNGPLVILRHALGPKVWGWPLADLAQHCTVAVTSDFLVPSATVCSQIAQDLGRKTFSLCAWSMAGADALMFAAAHLAGLEALILVDIVGLGSPLAESKGFEEQTPELPLPDADAWARQLWQGWVHQQHLDTREYEALLAEQLRALPDGVRRNRAQGQQALQKPLLDVLGQVTTPTLLMAGRYSNVLGPGAGETAVQRLAQGQLLVFENSAHALPLEEPERFQRELAAFVCEHAEAT